MTSTVIIPTYNYASTIIRAIDSIGEAEIIVVDDGSTDNTRAVVENKMLEDGRLKYHFQPNNGKAAATRKGVEMAGGDIIFTLDADDWFLPGKIEKTLAIFRQFPEVVHVASPAKIVWENRAKPEKSEELPVWLPGKEQKGAEVLDKFYKQNILFGGGSSYAARASVLKKMPLPDAVDMYTDEWLVLYTLMQGNSFFLEEPYSVWYVHNRNYSGKGGGERQKKLERLRKASEAVLGQMKETGFPLSLLRAYQLKDETRKMFWAEQLGTKKLSDVMDYAGKVLRGRHSWESIQQYHVLNRMIKFW